MHTENYLPVELDKVPLLAECSPQSLARLLPHVQVIHKHQADMLYRMGEDAKFMYYVVQGEVKLEMDYAEKPLNNQDSDPSDNVFFGEEAALKADKYSNTAVVVSDAILLAFSWKGLQRLVKDNPTIQARFYESLINHLSLAHPFSQKVSKPPKAEKGSYREGIGWILAIVIPALIIYFSSQADNQLTSAMISYFAIFSAAVVMWVFRLVEEYIPAVFIVVSVITMGLTPTSVILEGYASGSFFMALSVFGIGAVLLQSGLTYRVALLILRYTPNSGFWHIVSMFGLGVLLTPILPTANGRVSLIAPLLKDTVSLLKYKRQGIASTRMVSAAFMGVSLLSAGFLTSKSVNFALFGLFPQQVKDQFTWGYWVYASLIAMFVLLVGYFLHSALFFRTNENTKLTKNQLGEQVNLLGKMQWEEWVSLFGIVLFIIGVLSSSVHKIQPPWIGLAILYLMLTLGCLSKRDMRENIDWPFLIMLGGFVGMVKTMSFLGIDAWLAEHLVWLGDFMHSDFYLFVLLLAVSIYLIRLVVPNNAAIILVAAIFMPLAISQGINPWVIAFIVLVFSDGWIFPYQCSYYMQLLSLLSDEKMLAEKQMLKFNLQANLLRFAAIYASIPYWKHLGLL